MASPFADIVDSFRRKPLGADLVQEYERKVRQSSRTRSSSPRASPNREKDDEKTKEAKLVEKEAPIASPTKAALATNLEPPTRPRLVDWLLSTKLTPEALAENPSPSFATVEGSDSEAVVKRLAEVKSPTAAPPKKQSPKKRVNSRSPQPRRQKSSSPPARRAPLPKHDKSLHPSLGKKLAPPQHAPLVESYAALSHDSAPTSDWNIQSDHTSAHQQQAPKPTRYDPHAGWYSQRAGSPDIQEMHIVKSKARLELRELVYMEEEQKKKEADAKSAGTATCTQQKAVHHGEADPAREQPKVATPPPAEQIRPRRSVTVSKPQKSELDTRLPPAAMMQRMNPGGSPQRSPNGPSGRASSRNSAPSTKPGSILSSVTPRVPSHYVKVRKAEDGDGCSLITPEDWERIKSLSKRHWANRLYLAEE